MSYAEQNLISGEQVLYQTRLHWIVLLGPLLFAILLGLPGLIMLLTSFTSEGPTPLSLLLVLAAGGFFLLGYLKRKATEMAVTNKRILIKTGILSRRTFELLLSKVESIGVEEDLLGRMLGYGSVVVRGIGGTPEPFPMIAHPLEFRRQVQQQIEHREQEGVV